MGVGRMRVVELRVASCQLPVASCQLPVASGELPVAMENSVDSSSVFSKL